MLIDAHHHFWLPERGDYHWMRADNPVLNQPYGADDLAPLLREFRISRTILVQAACSNAETDFLLDQAASFPAVAGVVGWVDFTSPTAPQRIAELARNPLICGLRPMVQDIPDDDWLLRDDLAPAIETMERHDLVFEALTFPRHLSRLHRFLERFPRLRVVVDHGSKPDIARQALAPWRELMTAIARAPGTTCKISGLVTEASPNWSPEDLRPFVQHLLDTFGPDRLMWGSDWPVVNLAGGYARWRMAAEALLSALTPSERDHIFGGTAQRVYLQGTGSSKS